MAPGDIIYHMNTGAKKYMFCGWTYSDERLIGYLVLRADGDFVWSNIDDLPTSANRYSSDRDYGFDWRASDKNALITNVLTGRAAEITWYASDVERELIAQQVRNFDWSLVPEVTQANIFAVSLYLNNL